MTTGTRVMVKPLRRNKWLRGTVTEVSNGAVTVCTNEPVGSFTAHRFYTVPAERVREQ